MCWESSVVVCGGLVRLCCVARATVKVRSLVEEESAGSSRATESFLECGDEAAL